MFTDTQSFNIILDIDSIYKRLQKMPDFERALDVGLENGIKDLSRRIIWKLKENLSKYGLSASSLSRDIEVLMLDDGVYIGFSNDYYMYVEFGTGIVGLDNPHPNPGKADWEYDVNNRGESGWWYPSTGNDPNPNTRVAEDGTVLAWTKGQASRPFMYDTWLWASRSASQIVNKHIRKELKRLERDAK